MSAGICLRVLMSTDTLGGVWMYTVELARALRQQGVQVVLATMGAPVSASQREQVTQIPDLILCESRFRLEWMHDPWDHLSRAGHWLLALERRYQPDLVHLNHYSHGHLDFRAPCLIVGHSCVLSWWQAVLGEAPPAHLQTYRDWVGRGLAGADLVVAPTKTMLAALQTHYGLCAPSAVVPNGRRQSEYRQRQKRPYVLAVGRIWDKAKNLEILAEVAPRVSWPLYLAGEVHHPDGGRIDLQHVRMLGQLPPQALTQWYAHAAIYALPARYEPFGLSVLEAALCGCAPVLGDIASLRELWDGAACFVPADDPHALTAALKRLIEVPEQRCQLARQAQQRARRYTSRRMVSAYLRLYADLLGGRIPMDAAMQVASA